jgi:hypothetical protein
MPGEPWRCVDICSEHTNGASWLHLTAIARLSFRVALKITVAAGPSAIRSALIAMLLIKYLHLKSTFAWSLSNLVALLRQQLVVYRDLWLWIDDPLAEVLTSKARRFAQSRCPSNSCIRN